jgi:hypothetical protein
LGKAWLPDLLEGIFYFLKNIFNGHSLTIGLGIGSIFLPV